MTPITTPRRRRATAVAQLDLFDLIAEMERRDAEQAAVAAAQPTELQRQAKAAFERRHGRAPVRFRHPVTGQTWTGRGLRPRWVMDALEGGMTLEQIEVEQ